MKNILFYSLSLMILLTACKVEKNEKKEKKEEIEAVELVSFGKEITADYAISKKEMAEKFEAMNVGDTLEVKFTGEIGEVCQKKGCWIKVPLDEGKTSFVKFKDYAFFMPFNSAKSKVILNGKAFKSEVSVEELQHYAKDAGKSEEEIAKIVEPKVTYSFLADGVLLEAKADEE